MASKHEQNAYQAAHLFDLLDLRAGNSGLDIRELDAKIFKVQATMSEPEIAWVEKQIAQLHKTDAK